VSHVTQSAFPKKKKGKKTQSCGQVTNLTEDYIEKSIEELNEGHVNQVVKTDLIIGLTMRNLLIKLLNLLKHKGVLTPGSPPYDKGLQRHAGSNGLWNHGARNEYYRHTGRDKRQ
jgi:hypothetical protein